MRSIIKVIVLALVLVVGGVGGYFLAAGHSKVASPEAETLYTCGMHPQILQKKPGDCPICGMKLTPVRKQSETNSMTSNSQVITIDPAMVQNMNLRTSIVTNGPLKRVIRTVGAVDFDETSLADVTTKVKGWIEKLYVDTTGQQVHRGDPLFEVYSPELYSAQSEFVLALDSSDALKEAALNKLRFYDVTEAQIAELKATRKVQKTLRVVAPRDGVVVEKNAVQGQMVDAGMRLYRLADLGLVWIQAQVYEQDLAFVSLGQEATVELSYFPDRKFRGRVTYIYPTVDDKTRAGKIRMEFHNPGYFLKPGMFVTVQLESELERNAILVPDTAVLRSGDNNTVFVALDGGRFEPRSVALGERSEGNFYQVLSGLKEGERVVTSGEFMLDSESQLRDAIQKMSHPVAHSDKKPVVDVLAQKTEESGKTIYICPMPEHLSIRYDHPGKCPICSMALIPVSESLLAKIRPGGELDYYTCPMPEHAHVHLDKPGKCPECGMTLIPVMKTAIVAQPPVLVQTNASGTSSVLYTCPMEDDADVVSDKPGKCPKCGMKLVPTSTVEHGKIAEKHWLENHK
mgnify:CR=1 FL=1